jgi:hypothetical protein
MDVKTKGLEELISNEKGMVLLEGEGEGEAQVIEEKGEGKTLGGSYSAA